jgi:hypothetical protein
MAFALIFSRVVGVTLARRWFTNPRGQHFEIDQFVEFEMRVRHVCSLRQCANKTSALWLSRVQK